MEENNNPLTEHSNETVYVGPRFEKDISGTYALCLMLCGNIGGDVWTKLYKRSLYTKNSIIQSEAFSEYEDVMLNYQLFSVADSVSPLDCVPINHFLSREGSYSSRNRTRKFRIAAHQGIRHIASYGFAAEEVENAYYGHLGYHFLRCLKT